MYSDWRRIKIESTDVQSVVSHLKENNYHFLDPEFKQDNSVLTKGEFEGEI